MRLLDYRGGSGKTLEDLRTHISDRAREYLVCPISDLTVDGDSGELVRDNLRMMMTPFAASKLAHRVSLPGSFIKRAPNDLAAVNFNRFLPNAQGNVMLAIEHVENAPVVVGVLPPSANPIPLETLVEHFGNDTRGLDDGGWHHDDGGLLMRFTSPKLVAQPKVGDIVRAAVDIHDFENDTGLIDVTGALYRLVCGNGATTKAVTFGGRLRKEAWREPHAVLAAAAGYFEETLNGVGGYVRGLEELPNMEFVVPDEGSRRQRVIRRANAVVGVPGPMLESVSEAFRAEEPTMFGFHNALTRLGRDAKDRTTRASFERAGFNVITKREHVMAAVLAGQQQEEE